jgi:hypothetical protein
MVETSSKTLPRAPEAEIQDESLEDGNGNLNKETTRTSDNDTDREFDVDKLEDNGATGTRQFSYRTKFFLPTVLNHVRHSNYQKPKDKDEEEEWNDAAMEGYEICMINEDDEQAVQVIFESIYVSEDVMDVEDIKKPAFEKEKHLTPLEKNLDQSIQAAHAVLREMKYMEKRETRMRQTAESINSRVRWFSYLSIAVLFTVTYLQVTYLKRYFHKKKLM